LFSRTQNDHSKSELVLLITPHIIRNLAIPNAASTEFASGTDNNPSTRPLRLSQGAHISNINSLAVDVSERRQTDALPENYIDPALIEAKLGLAVPAQASAERTFPVAISIDANSSLQQLSFDLVINNGEVEIVTALDGGAMRNGSQPAQFRYQASAGQVHIDVLQPAGSQPHGIVALVQVKPKQASEQALGIKLENMVARNGMGEAVSAVLPEARQVRVAP
jgi:general secretion pathway protein D